MDKVRDYLSWLLKHPIAFAWILAFIAIALNWIVSGNSRHTPEAQNAAHTQMATANPQSPAVQAAHSGTAAATTAETVAAASMQSQTTQAPMNSTEPSAQGTVAQSTAETVQSAAGQATQAVMESQNTGAQVQAVQPVATAVLNAEQPANTEPVDTVTAAVATTTVVATADTDDTLSLLRAARQAYWEGVNTKNTAKLEESVGFYEKLVAQDANPAHKGELANVFWKMESPEKAADLYIEIGPWLKEQGRTIELINMKVYVDITNPEKGKKLGSLIGQ